VYKIRILSKPLNKLQKSFLQKLKEYKLFQILDSVVRHR
jgi:hypothetical protein